MYHFIYLSFLLLLIYDRFNLGVPSLCEDLLLDFFLYHHWSLSLVGNPFKAFYSVRHGQQSPELLLLSYQFNCIYFLLSPPPFIFCLQPSSFRLPIYLPFWLCFLPLSQSPSRLTSTSIRQVQGTSNNNNNNNNNNNRNNSFRIPSDPQQHHWTASWRAVLPTHSDMMNGIAYNTFLPSASTTINPSSYGGKHNKVSPYPYSKFSSQSLSSFDSTSLSPSSSKFQSHVAPPSSAKVVLPAKSVSQKKSTSTSVPFYLQIPSSISNSKGSLAEFAAQVQSIRLHLDWGEG